VSANAVRFRVPFGAQRRAPAPQDPARQAPPPPTHLARQLALAYFVEREIEAGRLKDYAAAARLLGLSRARVSQVIDLRLLPSKVQEEILLETGRALFWPLWDGMGPRIPNLQGSPASPRRIGGHRGFCADPSRPAADEAARKSRARPAGVESGRSLQDSRFIELEAR
jgi:hypothetical protein